MIEKIISRNEYFIVKKDEKLIQFGYEKGEFFCYEINENGFYIGKIDELEKFKKLHKKWKKEEKYDFKTYQISINKLDNFV